MSMTELGPCDSLSDANIAFYERIARGGAAVVTVGESIIPTSCGKTHPHMIMLGNPESYASLVRVCDAIHAQGALADIEISHGGYMADPIYNDGHNLIGPVALHDDYAGEVIGMDEAMLEEVAEAFADATETVRRLGFDMAMIHCGHGWLLNQFLSPLYNKRTDKYGGASIENRMRFPLMVLERVRDRVGKNYTLDMRVSGSEFLEGGAEIEDCVAFCLQAQRYVDIINVSAGAPWTKRMVPSVFDARGVNAVFAAAVKQAVDIPVTAVGGFADPDGMERVLKDGMADGIVIGRGIVADPDLPHKIMEGRPSTIHKCIRCFVCNESLYSTHNLRCSINPLAGREAIERYEKPIAARKRVFVAGGGPGGLVATITAARRGHEVTLFEASDALGGALKAEAVIPFKADMSAYIESLIAELAETDVMVRLNTALTPEIASAEHPDAIFAAIGAKPLIPSTLYEGAKTGDKSPIPFLTAEAYLENGINDDAYIGAWDGKRICIIGGGLVGAEVGLHLALLGKAVTVVEMRDEIAQDAAPDYRRFLMDEIAKHEDLLTCKTGFRYKEIVAGGVLCEPVRLAGTGSDAANRSDTEMIPADIAIIAMGYLPKEAETLRPYAPVFRLIGDCSRVARVYEAVRDGYDAGANL
jgi:2,4-dienoyl-CoA reductase-like NADH-dependent reductase (Old Yellow Enzyme family)/thioredoxin reductase